MFTREKKFGAVMILAAALCLFAPQEIHASVAAQQADGVMGQSITDETVYEDGQQDLDSRILKAARSSTLLGATSYSSDFTGKSFTTTSDYTGTTYYHKNDYANYTLFNGIDVSWWQSKGKSNDATRVVSALDWESIRDAGIDFTFVRVGSRDTSDGSIYEDDCASSHIKGATDNDIDVGLYIFSQALTEDEAIEEAEFVLDLVDKYDWDITMPIVMDREAGSYKRLTAGKLSKTKETAVIQAFTDTVTDAGYDACVYASYAWIKSYIDTDSLDDCSIWIARYNNTTTSNSKSGTAYADVAYDYEFWQYASTGTVDGYSSRLDVDFWYKDTSAKTTGLAMSENASSSISLSWSKTSDADGYRVYRYDSAQNKYVYAGATTKRTFTDTGLTAGTDYQYKVRAYWTIGGINYYGAYSAVLTATTAPAKVGGVSVTKSTATTMTIGWDSVKGATGYRVYQYDADAESFVKIADVESGETSYKITSLTSATDYRFEVRACRKKDADTYWGDYSEECAGYTLPGTVKNLLTDTESATAITVSWNKVARVTGYQVYRLNSSSGKYEKVATITDADTLEYADSGLSSGKEYTYKVRAYKTVDAVNYYGSYSAVSSATTKPAKVSSLKLTTKSSAVTLTWSKVSGATGYQIYRLNASTGKYVKIATVKGASTLTYKNTKLTKGKTYTYKVRAYKTYDGTSYCGSFSTTKNIKVK